MLAIWLKVVGRGLCALHQGMSPAALVFPGLGCAAACSAGCSVSKLFTTRGDDYEQEVKKIFFFFC